MASEGPMFISLLLKLCVMLKFPLVSTFERHKTLMHTARHFALAFHIQPVISCGFVSILGTVHAGSQLQI